MAESEILLDPSQVMRDLNAQIEQLDDDRWQISATILKSDFVSSPLSFQTLRALKTVISTNSGIPVEFLEFFDTQVIHNSSETITTRILIRRSLPPKGNTKVTLHTKLGTDGIPYRDTIAELEIFPINEFDQVTTVEHVLSAMKSTGILERFINIPVIVEAVKKSKYTRASLNKVIGAEGILPSPASDAAIQFYVTLEPDPSNISEYYTSRCVKKGNLICTKSPPMDGKKEGVDLFGQSITCTKALDFSMVAGKGASVDPMGLSLFANTDGTVMVERVYHQLYTAQGVRSILEKVIVTTSAVMEFDGSSVISITTDQPVLVKGDLAVGSLICATGDVIVMGNINRESSIQSKGNILVNGSVTSSSLSSAQDMAINGAVSNSSLNSSAVIKVNGNIEESKLIASEVYGSKVFNSSIIAEKNVKIEHLDMDEASAMVSIVMGLKDFFDARIKENETAVHRAEENITRLKQLFSDDVIEQASLGNTQVALLKHVSNWRKSHTGQPLQHEELEVHKQLLATIEPTYSMIKVRKMEIISLRGQLIQHNEHH